MVVIENIIAALRQRLFSEGIREKVFYVFYFLSAANFLIHKHFLEKLRALSFALGLTFSCFILLGIVAAIAKGSKKTISWILNISIISLFILDYVQLNIFYIFGENIVSDHVLILFNTNYLEAKQFITTYFDIHLHLYILFLLFLPFCAVFLGKYVFRKTHPSFITSKTRKLSIQITSHGNTSISHRGQLQSSRVLKIGLGCFVAIIFLLSVFLNPFPCIKNQRFNIFYAIYRASVEYRHETIGTQEIQNNISTFNLSNNASFSGEEAIYVLVIGESTTRNHMGLYGYDRNTNPRLSQLKNLYAFSDAISPASHTQSCLPFMLTLANSESTKAWYTYPDVISFFKATGFKTYWISNQEANGQAVSALAANADFHFFNDPKSNTPLGRNAKDGKLLPIFERVLQESAKKKFIVLHLMGTHMAYSDRYPQEFSVFDANPVKAKGRYFLDNAKTHIVDTYDNAVLYNDYIVAQLIDALQITGAVSYLVYVSDHGEEVYDSRNYFGHTQLVGSRYMVEIPFLVWLSDRYQSAYPETVTNVNGALHRPFMIDDLPYTLLELSQIFYQQFVPQKSLINPLFDAARRRDIRSTEYSLNYDDVLKDRNPMLPILECPEKLFLHRANTIEKVRLLENKYHGFEVDVVFDEHLRKFDIYHPPKPSQGLYLDKYLKSIDGLPYKKIWLDVKNLNETNFEPAFARLSFLMKKYHLTREQVIFESTQPQFLSRFRAIAFTSFYLPILDLSLMDDNQKQTAAIRIIEQAHVSKTDALSYPADMHAYVQTYIQPHCPEKKLLTWFLDDMSDYRNIVRLRQLAVDNAVSVILLHDSTDFDY